MFPCEPYAAVVVMTPEHYLPMNGIPETTLIDSYKAAFSFLRMVQKYDSGGVTGSINWNYMPHGGGSIIHPHLQPMAGRQPTNYHHALLAASETYYREMGGNLVSEFLTAEIESKERYLGRIGALHWMLSFAPRGMADVTVVFENRTALEDITDQDLADFAAGIQKVLSYYDSINLSGFNAAVFPGRKDSDGYWIMARLVGRFVLPPLGGSDMTQYQVLHGVNWSFISPETVAGEMVLFFNK
jgi:galactose-1-phosphate uridylyltransferase